jgi:hypothetical protein
MTQNSFVDPSTGTVKCEFSERIPLTAAGIPTGWFNIEIPGGNGAQLNTAIPVGQGCIEEISTSTSTAALAIGFPAGWASGQSCNYHHARSRLFRRDYKSKLIPHPLDPKITAINCAFQ